MLIFDIIWSLTSLIFFIIGIRQIKSKTPAGFFSGEEPPGPESISDVEGWNFDHGLMMIIFGSLYLVIGLLYSFAIYHMPDPMLPTIILVVLIIAGIILLVLRHLALEKKYKK